MDFDNVSMNMKMGHFLIKFKVDFISDCNDIPLHTKIATSRRNMQSSEEELCTTP